MEIVTTFQKEYNDYCHKKKTENSIIKLSDPYSSDRTVSINLHNRALEECTIIPIMKTLEKIGFDILLLDFSFNISFNDDCVVHLRKVLISAEQLIYLTLEKTGISDLGGITITKQVEVSQVYWKLDGMDPEKTHSSRR